MHCSAVHAVQRWMQWVRATHCAIFQHCWFMPQYYNSVYATINWIMKALRPPTSNATAFAMMRLVLKEKQKGCIIWQRCRLLCCILRVFLHRFWFWPLCWILCAFVHRFCGTDFVHRFAPSDHFIPLLKLLWKVRKPFPNFELSWLFETEKQSG